MTPRRSTEQSRQSSGCLGDKGKDQTNMKKSLRPRETSDLPASVSRIRLFGAAELAPTPKNRMWKKNGKRTDSERYHSPKGVKKQWKTFLGGLKCRVGFMDDIGGKRFGSPFVALGAYLHVPPSRV